MIQTKTKGTSSIIYWARTQHFLHMRLAKTQISLRIRAVWSDFFEEHSVGSQGSKEFSGVQWRLWSACANTSLGASAPISLLFLYSAIWTAARKTVFEHMLNGTDCCTATCAIASIAPANVQQRPWSDSAGSQGSKLFACGQLRVWSACACAQADLSPRWAHMQSCRKYCASAHISNVQNISHQKRLCSWNNTYSYIWASTSDKGPLRLDSLWQKLSGISHKAQSTHPYRITEYCQMYQRTGNTNGLLMGRMI